jgi:hypothetical protein
MINDKFKDRHRNPPAEVLPTIMESTSTLTPPEPDSAPPELAGIRQEDIFGGSVHTLNSGVDSVPPEPTEQAPRAPGSLEIDRELPVAVQEMIANKFKKPEVKKSQQREMGLGKGAYTPKEWRPQQTIQEYIRANKALGTSKPAATVQADINDNTFSSKPQLFRQSDWDAPEVQQSLVSFGEGAQYAAALPDIASAAGHKRPRDDSTDSYTRPAVKTEPDTKATMESAPYPPDAFDRSLGGAPPIYPLDNGYALGM